MFFKIVGETARASAFIARDMKSSQVKRAVGEMDFSIRAVHPCAAEPASSQNDGPIAFPSSRIVILAPDREANGRRTLPFPLPEKFIQFRRVRSHAPPPGLSCSRCLSENPPAHQKDQPGSGRFDVGGAGP